MEAVIVRYELDPSRLDEHLGLITAVFDHLRATAAEGVRYGVMRSEDGMAFTHIGLYDTPAARAAATGSAPFQAFAAKVGERCVVPPASDNQTVVEGYGIFS